jgi:hypothetical protein
VNKYLEKIASFRRLHEGMTKAWGEVPTPTKLSLGIGMSSLGVGTANLVASQRRANRQEQQKNLEQKSLNALKGIHQTLIQAQEKQ